MNKKYLVNKFLNFAQYRFLSGATKKLKAVRRKTFENIGAAKLPRNAPHAMVINISTAIPYYLEGSVDRCPILDNHALYWEAAELVRQLNSRGWVVDFIDCNDVDVNINWQKYQLVFDERNHLMFSPLIKGQKKVFYSTGLKWTFHNEEQLKRLNWFFKRTGIRIYPERFLFPNYSDEFADYQTYYGKADFMTMFSSNSIKVPLDVSCTFVPSNFDNRKRRLNRFVWFGGSGSIHKGLDLAIEAFKHLTNCELIIFGPVEREVHFYNWLKKVMSEYPNIQYYGYADLKNEEHLTILSSAVANVFPSCSEGGPGSVAQAALLGLIPIVTSTANIRYENLGYVIENGSDEQMINSIVEKVKSLMSIPEKRVLEQMEENYVYAAKFHTRDAYKNSLANLLNTIA